MATAEGATTKFNATIDGAGTCAMSFNPAGMLTLDSTNAADAINASTPPVLSIKKTTLTFKDCSGWAGGLTPTLTVSGSTSTDNAVALNQPFLLKSSGGAGGTSKGFGFVMGKAMTGTITWGEGDSGVYKFDEPVEISLGTKGVAMTNGTTRDIYFGLSCGTAASCASTKVNAGTLNASLIFSFHYK
ncbi:TPA: hypothetical protein KEY88_005204 [Serratia marcescens]|uniref:Fimbrial protein n=1 Tax=Serratia ureilytica TaxID=300181 RepID=A0A9X9BYC8_9GAMM|nr:MULTISPECIES: hypothetical protein [Serratia]MBS3894522.1 hypothetical protein [Serratia marcescens]TXE22534.1 hypothetical protein FOT63_25475 [Serratia ureilytica]HBC7422436.1 hypothetical protein [Serratia marcescens]